ncbi:MAG: hypothetical protein HY592_03170 [Candidatus Omnitrophica bacterium]|nr:hypothetical protein [Candidatus Omnitrophota bacterium]
MSTQEAKEPFIFKTQLSLTELTGLKASDLSELRHHLETVPESCVYYHTHHFLEQHQFLTPEPPNDFAYWVVNVLQEELIGERLAAIDTIQYHSLEALRKAILTTLDQFLAERPHLRKAPVGQEFHFMRCALFAIPTRFTARNLKEFVECLKKVGISSLYYHIFEGRLRPPLGVSDFSDWLEKNLGEKELARKIDRLDPYTLTMDGLRKKIIGFITD